MRPRPPSIRRALAPLLLVVLAGPAPARGEVPSLSVGRGSFRVGSRRDGFTVRGRVAALTLRGAETLTVELGPLRFDVPVRASRKGRMLDYRATKGAAGLRRLHADARTGRFALRGDRLALGDLPNPLAVRLGTGGAEACAVLRVRERRARRRGRGGSERRLVGGRRAASPCLFTRLDLEPPNVVAGVPTTVQVEAMVEGTAPGGAELYRAGADGRPAGSPLCRLAEDVAGRLTCAVTFAEAVVGTVPLVVMGALGNQTAFSAGARLAVVRGMTDEDAAAIAMTAADIETLWTELRGRWGDTARARVELVLALRARPDIQDASLAGNLCDVSFRYSSGVLGTLEICLRPDTPALAAPLRRPRALLGRGPTGTDRAGVAVGASAVLWDPGYFFDASESGAIAGLLGLSTDPVFALSRVNEQAATVDSLVGICQWATRVFVTHGFVIDGRVGFQTETPKNAENLKIYKDALQAGELAVGGRIIAMPGWLRKHGGACGSGITWGGACSSTFNDTMARVFTSAGGAYFGFSKTVKSAFAAKEAKQLFCRLLAERMETGAAYADVAPKADTDGTRFEMHGGAALGFGGQQAEDLNVEIYPSKACVGPKSDPVHFTVQVPERHAVLKPCVTCTWKSEGHTGQLTGGEDDADDDFATCGARLTPGGTAEATETITVEVETRGSKRVVADATAEVTLVCPTADFSQTQLVPAAAQVALDGEQTVSVQVPGIEGCDIAYEWQLLNCGSITDGMTTGAQITASATAVTFRPAGAGGLPSCKGDDYASLSVQVIARACDVDEDWRRSIGHATSDLTVVCTKCGGSGSVANADQCTVAEACCEDEKDNDNDGDVDCNDTDCDPCTYTVAGQNGGAFVVDDDLDFYVNGTLVRSDGNALSGSRSPIAFTARRGDTLRFVVRDTYGYCSSLTPLYLADGRGHSALAASGFNLGCGRPGGNQGVVYDTTFSIPF